MQPVEIIWVVVVLGLVVLSIVWHYSRAASLLQQWADENGYRVVFSEYRHLVRGPFFWTTSEGQAVEDSQGSFHDGWVRCGGWFLGMLSDHVEARWDD